MKLARKKPTKSKAVAKKPKFDFKQFINSINSLNAQNFGSAPALVKGFIIVMLIVFILVLSWFLLVSNKLEQIKQAEAEQETLLEQYRIKESKARHLEVYNDQVVQMQLQFAELLGQLPQDTMVSELIEGISMAGSGSGLRFQDITVQPEIEQEYFIEQPITITGIGDYHKFGDFVSSIAALPRIITMHNFEVKNTQPSLDVMPQLQLVLQTKTYRSKQVSLEEDEGAEQEGE